MPTVITGPGFMAGGQVRALVTTTDIAPTLIDAAGLPVPEEMQGRSILPLVRDARADWRDERLRPDQRDRDAAAPCAPPAGSTASPPTYDHEAAGAAAYREAFLYDLDAIRRRWST